MTEKKLGKYRTFIVSYLKEQYMLYFWMEKLKRTIATYIVTREGLPTNAFSGIDLILLL